MNDKNVYYEDEDFYYMMPIYLPSGTFYPPPVPKKPPIEDAEFEIVEMKQLPE